MCLEKVGDVPLLSTNADPAPQFWGNTLRRVLSRGDSLEDEREAETRHDKEQSEEGSWSGWR